jgi:hypothetical protein
MICQVHSRLIKTKKKKSPTKMSSGDNEEKRVRLIYSLGTFPLAEPLWKTTQQFLQKIYDPEIPFLDKHAQQK